MCARSDSARVRPLMKPRDIFSIAVRMIGLVFLYQGLSSVPTAVANICPVFPHFYFRALWPASFLVGWPLVMAWWLVRGAPWLMRLAFESEDRTAAPNPSELAGRL